MKRRPTVTYQVVKSIFRIQHAMYRFLPFTPSSLKRPVTQQEGFAVQSSHAKTVMPINVHSP